MFDLAVSSTNESDVMSTPGVIVTLVAPAAIAATPLILSKRTRPDVLIAYPFVLMPSTAVPVLLSPWTPTVPAPWTPWLEELRPFHDVGVALRMSEDGGEPRNMQTEELVGQVERPAVVRRLDEEVPGSAEREALKLFLRSLQLREVELSPSDELDRRSCSLERVQCSLHRLDGRRVVTPDMRCRRQHGDPVRRGSRADRKRLLQVGSAVVETRKDVRVEIDQRAANATNSSRAERIPSGT